MNQWKDLFDEKLRPEFEREVLKAAGQELEQQAPSRRFFLKTWPLAGVLAAGLGAVVWLRFGSSVNPMEDEMMLELAALPEADLEDFEFIEDFEMIEEMDELDQA